jgi:hypothetical protein
MRGALLAGVLIATGAAAQPAGRAFEAQVKLRDVSAWEAAKERLADFMQGYVEKDVTRSMKALSREFTQDTAVLRNALLSDFQDQSNFNVDLELLNYQTRFEGATVGLRWLRTATVQQNGQTIVETGRARVQHDRHDGYRLLNWQGPSPFGRTDDAWLHQAQVGDPGLLTFSLQTQSFASIDATSGNPEDLAIDLEGSSGSVTRFRGSACPGCAAPPQDLVLQFVRVGPHLAVAFFSTDKSPEINTAGDNAIPSGAIDCASASVLEDVGSIDTGTLQLFKTNAGILNLFPGGSGAIVFGVVTHEENYGVLEVRARHVTGDLVDVTLRWKVHGPSPSFGTGGGGC